MLIQTAIIKDISSKTKKLKVKVKGFQGNGMRKGNQ